jgi:hypothetical protein
VNDDVAVIEEDPLRLGFAFVPQRLHVEVFAKALLDTLGKGLDVRA